ncbi:hypothetical protein R1sor_008738 [Riccia sorocarpa]|uniref:Uncharacterized protein n=1 Tax=Riccia sorocarpa TaxID=122646 RepID=A0ABD3HU98_9MARC
MKKIPSWKKKKTLVNRFWDARSEMYNTGKSASLISKMAFVVPRPRRLDADDVFEWLIQFEEEKRKRKWKTTTAPPRNTKKPRPVESVPEEPFDPMTKFSEKDEKKALKTDFKKYRHMYPFGPTSVYHIPVEKIREAPPIFVYRSINFQYVLDMYYNMITKSHFTPQIADLLPFSQKDSSPIVLEIYAKTHKLNWSEDLSLVRALIADPDVVFLAISRQHSSRAQQLLLLEVRVPEDVQEQNRYRRSHILNGGFDPTKYHDISYLDNKNNETQVFVPSFVECLNQAKAQWITLRRPKSTQGSTTKNDPFDQFKSIVYQTMGRRSYKEVMTLVCCSDETYAVFEKFVKRWKEGKIPDVHGTIGPSKDPRTDLEQHGSWGEASSSDEESNKNKKKAKKKTVEVLPSQITTAIHRLYTAKHGIAAPSRQEPLHILHLPSVCQYKLTLDEQLNWTSQSPRSLRLGPEEYKPKLVDNFDYRPHSCELRYKTWKEEFTLDKGVGSEAVNIKNKAPRWDFVGIEPPEASKPYVHPGSKRRFFCTRLVNNFSSEGTTVLDFFSGGVFAREALMSSRDVIFFASSQLEAEFMAKFGKLLQTHSNRVREWFETYKKKHGGHVEVEAPLQQAEQSGTVTVAALTTPFVADGSVMASAIERLANCPQISYQARVEEDESNPQGDLSNPQGDLSNPQAFEGGGSGLVPDFDWGASTTHIEQGASKTQNEQGASTAQEPWIIGTPQSGEEFPLANILSQPISVEATEDASPVQASDRNDNSEPIAGFLVTADNAADEVPPAVDEGRPEDNATAAAEEANAQIPGNTSSEKPAIQP